MAGLVAQGLSIHDSLNPALAREDNVTNAEPPGGSNGCMPGDILSAADAEH